MSPGRQRQSIKGKKKKSRECHQCFILVLNIEHIIKLINMIDYKKKKDYLLVKDGGIYLKWKVGALEENMHLKNAV